MEWLDFFLGSFFGFVSAVLYIYGPGIWKTMQIAWTLAKTGKMASKELNNPDSPITKALQDKDLVKGVTGLMEQFLGTKKGKSSTDQNLTPLQQTFQCYLKPATAEKLITSIEDFVNHNINQDIKVTAVDIAGMMQKIFLEKDGVMEEAIVKHWGAAGAENISQVIADIRKDSLKQRPPKSAVSPVVALQQFMEAGKKYSSISDVMRSPEIAIYAQDLMGYFWSESETPDPLARKLRSDQPPPLTNASFDNSINQAFGMLQEKLGEGGFLKDPQFAGAQQMIGGMLQSPEMKNMMGKLLAAFTPNEPAKEVPEKPVSND